MVNGPAGVGGKDVRRVLNPWRSLVQCVVDRCQGRVFLRSEGDVVPADAIDNDGDGRQGGGIHVG